MRLHPTAQRHRRGVALILSLFFVSLVTILVIGFLTSMRSERFSADAHLQSIRAQNLAQTGVDIVCARITQTTQTGSFWISQPGRITCATLSSSGFTPADLKNVDLHSGATQSGDTIDLSVDLNLPNAFSSSRNLITSQNVNLKVRWIYLRQDGTIIVPSGSTPPTYSKSNPLVGRFAFWADDNGGRIDLNTAWRRSVTVPRWDPSQLNLTVFSSLTTAVADTLKSYRTSRHYLHTLDEARAVDTSLSSVIDSNRIDLSILNRAPETNLFGEPRIMLTTKKALAGTQPYLNILADETADPGLISNVSGSSTSDKLALVTASLTTLLTRTDWPMNPGHSLSEKFAPIRPEQIATNIIEYVRARESSQDIVEPIRGYLASSGKVVLGASTANNVLIGNNRGPRITEVAVWIDAATSIVSGVTGYNATYITELYLPPDFGVDKIDLTQLTLIRLYGIGTGAGPTPGLTGTPSSPDPSSAITLSDLDGGTDPYLRAGQCRVVSHSFRINVTTRPTVLCLRVALSKNSSAGTRLDVTTLGSYVGNVGINCTIDNTGLPASKIPSCEIYDPCANKFTTDWTTRSVNTFGTAPVKGTVKSGLSAQQDTDSSGLLSNSSQHFPVPSGKSGNLYGVMESVAELGFVHTGTESITASIPFRTVRLQPQSGLQMPDWVLLDLFCVPYKQTPATTTVSFYTWTSTYSRGGLINPNAYTQGALIPFLTSSGISLIQRKYGFLAALTGAYCNDAATTSFSATQADTLQTNLAKYTLSTGTSAGRDYGFSKLLLSRGQLAELSGFSDSGESSEAQLRGFIDLTDVRSNAYTVYAIGQSVRQATNQTIIIQAEQRIETILLRDSNGKVRQYFSRNLRP